MCLAATQRQTAAVFPIVWFSINALESGAVRVTVRGNAGGTELGFGPDDRKGARLQWHD
jgi:hypothetical protein